jgi:hypothetical protein
VATNGSFWHLSRHIECSDEAALSGARRQTRHLPSAGMSDHRAGGLNIFRKRPASTRRTLGSQARNALTRGLTTTSPLVNWPSQV